MSPAFLNGLQEYSWPGNTRQLQNSIVRAYYTGTGAELSAEDLAHTLEQAAPDEPPAAARAESGEGAIMAAMTICNGNVQAAAERLGLSRATLYRRLNQYGIHPKQLKK